MAIYTDYSVLLVTFTHMDTYWYAVGRIQGPEFQDIIISVGGKMPLQLYGKETVFDVNVKIENSQMTIIW